MTTRLPADEGRIEGSILAGTGQDVWVLANNRGSALWSSLGLTDRDWLAIDAWMVGYLNCQQGYERDAAAKKSRRYKRKLDKLAAMIAELKAREEATDDRTA